MSFPASTISPPSLGAYQFSFNGQSFGGTSSGAQYSFVSAAGLGQPPIQSGDIQRPADNGQIIGLDLIGGRDIVVSVVVHAISGQTIDAAIAALTSPLSPGGATEYPLFFRKGDATVYAVMARFRDFQVTVDLNYVQANAAVVSLQFHATDPRIYSTPTLTASCGLGTQLGGLTFPLTFPMVFASGSVAGTLTALNSGTFDVRPIFTITGPCVQPRIINSSLTGTPYLAFTGTLYTGDTLVVDSDWHSVLYTASGSTTPASRANWVTPASSWWDLPPGTSTIGFLSSDPTRTAATLTVTWASAWAFI